MDPCRPASSPDLACRPGASCCSPTRCMVRYMALARASRIDRCQKGLSSLLIQLSPSWGICDGPACSLLPACARRRLAAAGAAAAGGGRAASCALLVALFARHVVATHEGGLDVGQPHKKVHEDHAQEQVDLRGLCAQGRAVPPELRCKAGTPLWVLIAKSGSSSCCLVRFLPTLPASSTETRPLTTAMAQPNTRPVIRTWIRKRRGVGARFSERVALKKCSVRRCMWEDAAARKPSPSCGQRTQLGSTVGCGQRLHSKGTHQAVAMLSTWEACLRTTPIFQPTTCSHPSPDHQSQQVRTFCRPAPVPCTSPAAAASSR